MSKLYIALGFFLLTGAFAAHTVSGEESQKQSKGKPKNPPATGVITYAHHTKTVNNQTCSAPPEHVQAAPLNPPYQSIPRTNPMFCWANFAPNPTLLTNWSFTLKDGNVTVCSTGTVDTTVTSKTCNVTLKANYFYTGYLEHLYNGANYSDNHTFKTP